MSTRASKKSQKFFFGKNHGNKNLCIFVSAKRKNICNIATHIKKKITFALSV